MMKELTITVVNERNQVLRATWNGDGQVVRGDAKKVLALLGATKLGEEPVPGKQRPSGVGRGNVAEWPPRRNPAAAAAPGGAAPAPTPLPDAEDELLADDPFTP